MYLFCSTSGDETTPDLERLGEIWLTRLGVASICVSPWIIQYTGVDRKHVQYMEITLLLSLRWFTFISKTAQFLSSSTHATVHPVEPSLYYWVHASKLNQLRSVLVQVICSKSCVAYVLPSNQMLKLPDTKSVDKGVTQTVARLFVY